LSFKSIELGYNKFV